MTPMKIHFGGRIPPAMEATNRPNGFREVWVYNNIQQEKDETGAVGYVADGICIETLLSDAEIEERRAEYFREPDPSVEEQLADLTDLVGVLTEVICGGD